ncbi:MAG TPA: hypothetical protein EYQ81_09820, partial [Sneathiellales bacterium]|nr:hypothetical protein [Sneathiellales bacterium]
IEDPFGLPKKKSKLIVSRPGVTQVIDFPVQNTGEVDGTIYLDDDGENRPMAGVELQLLNDNAEIVETTRSANDGFYLFTMVKPGHYTVDIPKLGGGRQRDFLVDPSAPIEIDARGSIISDLVFLVRTRTAIALKRELEMRRQLDEELALRVDSLERIPRRVPRRSDPNVGTVVSE